MQPSFLSDDVVERHAGPALTGQQEFLRAQAEATVRRMNESVADWRPPDLPDLSRFDTVIMDLESTGLRWWDQDRMIGMGLETPDGVRRYLPIRHRGGQNLPCEATFWRWARHELRGKRIVNIRTKFDLHLLRADDVDLEAQGCTFGDVAHYAALLDDHRRLFNQADLAKHYLEDKCIPPGTGKITSSHGFELDPTKFADYPAGLVAPRAEGDVHIVGLLQQVMWPMLTEQDLHRVREIEDAIIPVVVEMEHNGAPIDVETLNTWVLEAQKVVEEILFDIYKMTGLQMSSFGKADEIQQLFRILNLPVPLDAETGKFTKADAELKKCTHPTITKLREGIAVQSLLSKFLLKYQKSVARDGILRYELHQLPYQDDEEGHGGAVSGRFSSAAPSRDEGANIQQVIGIKKQRESFTGRWPIKTLFKPDRKAHPDAVWFKADASQFQFRLFAHYADSPDIIAAYQRDNDWEAIAARAAAKIAAGIELTKDDKLADYHEIVQELVKTKAGKELNRTHTKNVNFAQVFGAGIDKMAEQLGCLREVAEEISKIYHKMFPGVKPLLQLTSHLAMPGHDCGRHECGWACDKFYRQGYHHRGYVKTYLGRRARFGSHDRHYSALNRIIQGTEGDVNKRIMIEVHALRKELGLTERFTVHDELDCDLHDPKNFARVKAVLNTQYYDFKVPILWEAGIGPSWAEAK
jgi:DNA polymerase-1